jgi:hypothetical protein
MFVPPDEDGLFGCTVIMFLICAAILFYVIATAGLW